MLVALITVLLNAFGAAPSPEDLREMQLRFNDRGHHLHFDFGSTRGPDSPKQLTIGFGYEYYVARRFHGVSFEVLGQKLGKMFKGEQDWWVGGGLGYYPIRKLKLFMQAGALFEDGDVATRGRVGVGYRLEFFVLQVMPFVYVETTDGGQFTWSLGARIQY